MGFEFVVAMNIEIIEQCWWLYPDIRGSRFSRNVSTYNSL